jgi:DNA (cytosine-5)-methyltransferase 1
MATAVTAIDACPQAEDGATPPTIASFFSGIGGFDLGFEIAGFEVTYQCEIDEFCTSILERHWPRVIRSRDIREIRNGTAIPDADVWCAGFPCQDVSLARARPRAGLRGSQTGLFYPFAQLIGEALPEVVVLENVPGLLSSHCGRDFGIVLQTLAALGYAVAWRVLDSRYFGVPQSRSRLYIVGYFGNPRSCGEILFESERSEGDSPPSRPSRTKFISPFKEILGDSRRGPLVQRIGYCLAATSGRHTGTDWSRTYVTYPGRVRRLTPLEAERLQGFPDGWTLPPDSGGRDVEGLDSARYAALGNAVTVPVVDWLARRIGASLCASVEVMGEATQLARV